MPVSTHSCTITWLRAEAARFRRRPVIADAVDERPGASRHQRNARRPGRRAAGGGRADAGGALEGDDGQRLVEAARSTASTITVALVSGAAAIAVQISDAPNWVFARCLQRPLQAGAGNLERLRRTRGDRPTTTNATSRSALRRRDRRGHDRPSAVDRDDGVDRKRGGRRARRDDQRDRAAGRDLRARRRRLADDRSGRHGRARRRRHRADREARARDRCRRCRLGLADDVRRRHLRQAGRNDQRHRAAGRRPACRPPGSG